MVLDMLKVEILEWLIAMLDCALEACANCLLDIRD
jgi:hypothetical protein